MPTVHPSERTRAARRAIGRLIFANDLYEGDRIPLHHVQIEIRARHFLGSTVVGRGVSDADGRFDIPLEGGSGETHLELRLLVSDRTYAPAGQPVDTPRQVWKQRVEVLSDGQSADLGTLLVEYWPYRSDYPVPRAASHFGRLPEKLPAGVLLQEELEGVRAVVHSLDNLVISEISPDSLRIIQEAFPETLTQQVGAQRSRSDAWLGDRVLNGHYPILLARDARDPSRWRVKLEWGDIACKGAHDLSDVDVTFAPDGEELKPVEMRLRIRRARGDRHWAEPIEWQAFTPGHERWEQAKRVFRSHYMLAGEIDSHMVMAHMRVEQYALPAHRNLRLNPLAQLLLPHLSEVAATNALGDFVAWGPASVTCVGTALSEADVRARFARLSAAADWKGWRPRRPLCEAHRFARAANVYWDVLDEYVTRWFDRHLEAVVAHWVEVYRMSRDLVANSLPYLPPADDPDLVWDDPSERDCGLPRERHDGALRALRPITGHAAHPPVEDVLGLMELCKYVIYHATFYHGWVHDRQDEDGGELAYAPQALRNGSLGDEDDASVNPHPTEAYQYLLTLAVGDKTRYGYVLKDELRDLPPLLRAVLDARAGKLEEVGYDLTTLRSRVNI